MATYLGTVTKEAPSRGRPRRTSRWTYATLTLIVLVSFFPLYFMFVGASRTNDQIGQVPPPLLPGGNLFKNLSRVFGNHDANILTGLVNSLVAAACVTVSVVFFASLAGFAFAKLRFRGANALLLVIIGAMMIPVQLGVIPLYLTMVRLGWNSHLEAIIVPFMVSGFGVFMMRQYAAQAVPDELIEAARVDGCNTWRMYWNVVLPALRPAAAVLGIFSFITCWNDFFWPLVIMQDPNNPTVQISLRSLGTGYYQDYSQVFAGTFVATVPLLLVFIVFGRQIIGGIMEGAVKA
ncbi:MAG TPA: carbohydrate ABC transporter permease [Micromonosporaceae bacterium]|nr:carbohydrate ABC transporter permease [Micromonosporaceae bacterium]